MYMYIPFLFVSCTGSHVANEVYQLVTTLILLRLLSLNFPHKFQLDFPPKVAILSSSTDYKTSVESAVKFVNKLDGHYPSLSGYLELGYSWLNSVNKLLWDCCLPEKH